MKNIEIKEMNSEERLNHVIMLTNAYKGLVISNIYNGYDDAEWNSEFRLVCNILNNMLKMRGKRIDATYYIR